MKTVYVICTYNKKDYPGREIPYCSDQDGILVEDKGNGEVEAAGERLVDGDEGRGWVARAL